MSCVFTGNYNINALNNLVEKELMGWIMLISMKYPSKNLIGKSDADNIAGFNKFMQGEWRVLKRRISKCIE
ncbi:MAG: hypothetical protein IPL08_13050 [Saprospiraceae bacterium]|nr:hypothetical protein [Saprospiraceae bacterium]